MFCGFQYVFRDVAQVVERYFREVEAASSSLVTPILKNSDNHQMWWLAGFFFCAQFLSARGRLMNNYEASLNFEINIT